MNTETLTTYTTRDAKERDSSMTHSELRLSPQRIEERKIEAILEQYKEATGDAYDIIPVGEVGYILQSREHTPTPERDWFMFDYDYTLAQVNEAKERRFKLYKEHTTNLGINASDEQLERAIKITDKFARMDVIPGKGESYSPGAHAVALDWATKRLQAAASTDAYDDVLTKTDQDLKRIREQLPNTDEDGAVTAPKNTRLADDPFYFRSEDHRLVTSKDPWAKGIEKTISQTVSNPELYTETVEAASRVGQRQGEAEESNLGVFTFGHPDNQITKVLRLIAREPDFRPNQIWLSKVRKGEFLKELVKLQSQKDAMVFNGRAHVNPLSKDEHIIVVMDDNKKELNSILEANPTVRENSGALLSVVRSTRPGTKTGREEWAVEAPNENVDFSREDLTADDAKHILQHSRTMARTQLADMI